jgi:hypothetical protein
MKIKMLLITLISSMTIQTFATEIYVSNSGNDSNAGSVSSPFRTIQKASSVATAGTTVHVAPGIYQEQITSNSSGTPNSRIKFVSDIKWKAKIIPLDSAGFIWTVNGGYTDVIGFEVDGSKNTSVRTAISLTGGNSSVQNSLVHHIAENIICDNMGGAGLWAGQYRGANFNNYDFIGNVVHHVGGTCGYISAEATPFTFIMMTMT